MSRIVGTGLFEAHVAHLCKVVVDENLQRAELGDVNQLAALQARRLRVKGEQHGERAQEQDTDRPAQRPEARNSRNVRLNTSSTEAIEQARNDTPFDCGKDDEA